MATFRDNGYNYIFIIDDETKRRAIALGSRLIFIPLKTLDFVNGVITSTPDDASSSIWIYTTFTVNRLAIRFNRTVFKSLIAVMAFNYFGARITNVEELSRSFKQNMTRIQICDKNFIRKSTKHARRRLIDEPVDCGIPIRHFIKEDGEEIVNTDTYALFKITGSDEIDRDGDLIKCTVDSITEFERRLGAFDLYNLVKYANDIVTNQPGPQFSMLFADEFILAYKNISNCVNLYKIDYNLPRFISNISPSPNDLFNAQAIIYSSNVTDIGEFGKR